MKLALGVAIVLVLSVVWFLFRQTSPSTLQEPSPHIPLAVPSPSVALSRVSSSGPVSKKYSILTGNHPLPISEVIPTPEPQKEAIRSKLMEYASTYEATSLPLIAPYLSSNDREIRDAAVNAIVMLGDSSGGAILRKAAASIKDPQEAATMLNQAAYVELPRGVPAQLSKLAKKSKTSADH